MRTDVAPASTPAAPVDGERGPATRVALMIAALLGASLIVVLVGYFGLGVVAGSVARIGIGGFAIFCAWTLANYAILGVCWFVLAPGLPLRLMPAFYWGRLMREAASDILPFSQLGGFVIGARAAGTLGAPAASTMASTLVDISAELVGQLMFTAVGVVLVAAGAGGGSIKRLESPLFIAGFAGIALVAVSFMGVQWKGVKLLRGFSQRWLPKMVGKLDAIQAGVDRVYDSPIRLALCVGLHLLAWITATGGVWLALRFMHSPITLQAAIALESLIYLIRSAAFLVPGAIGVLESGYVLLSPLFGLTPEIGLALALIKRGRDLSIGMPAVAVWQIMEGRRFLHRRRPAVTQPTP